VGSLLEVRYLYRYDGGKFEQPVYKGTEEAAVLSQVTRIKVRGATDGPAVAEPEEEEEAVRPRG
jgi:bifunctional non-homologous end joining protein LigD